MSALKRLFIYAKAFRKDVAWATSFSVLNQTFDIFPEILIGIAVDVVVNQKQSFLGRLGISDLFMQLVLVGALTLLAFVLESLFQFLYQVKWRNLAQAVQHRMRLDAYAHVQKLDFAYFENKSTGKLLSIINDDVNQLERFLDGGANSLIQVTTSTVLIGAIFFYISPVIAAVALAPMPLILWGAYKFQRLLGPRYKDMREKAGLISGRLSNNLIGLPTIKSYGSESYELVQLKNDSLAYREANHKAIRLSAAYIPLVRMAIVAGFIATLVLGGYFAIEGSLAIASYSVLVFLTQRLLWPFTRLAEMTDLYQRGMASADRVLDLLETPFAIDDGKIPLQQVKGDINFDDVAFNYAKSRSVLKNFNLRIAAGTTIAFVGPTGAGKSTIIKLLMRFYLPTHGRITIDGHDLSQLKQEDLRKAISLVSQDVYLFPGSVRANIAYGSPQATLAEIERAAQIAEAHLFITSLPQGYDTEVGERGIKLSGGQKQRICIARAVLKNSPIFIFDEATSSVDNETEEAIQRSLAKIVKGRTTIMIAHRLSTIRHANQIYVLKSGQIVEKGTHETLCRQAGLYAKLWQIQTGVMVD